MTIEDSLRLAEQLSGYAEDPVGFAIDVLNVDVDDWQRRFLETVAEFNRVAVRSSTGQGKDFTTGIADLWFLASFWKAYCPVTANSKEQLERIFWKQLSDLINGSNGLDEIFEWNATTIKHRDPKLAPEWLIFAATSAKKTSSGGEQHAEGSSGHHSDNMMLTLDEAPGIDEVFWQAWEPTLTGPNNKIVALGNPNRLSGSFYQIWYKARVSGFWKRFTIAGKDSPKLRAAAAAGDEVFISPRGNQSGNHDYLIAKWGSNHPIVQSKVYGVHPTIAGERVGFAWEEIQAARARTIIPGDLDSVQIGCDASSGGRDRTVYFIRRGRKFRMIVERPASVHRIVERLLEIADDEPDPTAEQFDYQPLIVPDDGGLIDLSGWLKKSGYQHVRGVHFGGAPRDKKHFFNLAAEMWLHDLKAYFECVNILESGFVCGRSFEAHHDEIIDVGEPVPRCALYMPAIDLPGDEAGEEGDELLNQLISRQWFFTGKEQIQRALMSKDEIRKNGGHSPDHADALCLSVVRPKQVRLI